MSLSKLSFLFTLLMFSYFIGFAQNDSTYAERLGFPKGSKVIILHVDDAGMTYDSNTGAIEAMTHGVASSCSVMMPCPWVPAFVHFLKQHPEMDAGLHLTLTAEWKEYRWPPVSGKSSVPGLTDGEGDLWPSVEEVVKHASADEVDKEIRAQLERAVNMGFRPTHIDSHMGTLFASPAFAERYIRLGIEKGIPVMYPGGHNTLIKQETGSTDEFMNRARSIGKQLWKAGLPVLDDLFNDSYNWKYQGSDSDNADSIRKYKTAYYKQALASLKPGVTMVIMHCTNVSPTFKYISDSGTTRLGDLLAMTDPELRKYITTNGFIITTWRELMQRRGNVK